MEMTFPSGARLVLVQGDITKIAADAMANAANSRLAGGGGVDGAIHRAGGPTILRELDAIREAAGGCPTGSAVATSAGRLPARHVFHAVGPVWRGGGMGEAELLAEAYRACLRLAEEHRAAALTLPSISTGVYGYPVEQAAEVAVGVVAAHLAAGAGVLREVTFVLFDAGTLAAYEMALAAVRERPVQ
ncbi:MAG: macro domain-containing protein [Acidobacteria bacterium]|nr:macro domain-containing protein [Acidobacteriota bacterium]